MTIETRRLLDTFDRASDDSLAYGRSWYPAAHAFAVGLAKQHGITLKQACAIIAILSPQLSWAKNMAYAEEFLSTGTAPTFDRSIAKCHAVLEYRGDPLEVEYVWYVKRTGDDTALYGALSGPKVCAFYNAILAPDRYSTPVVDRHMVDCAADRRGASNVTLTGKRYAELAQAIDEAAQLRRCPVHVFQATVWCQWKTEHEQADEHGWLVAA